MATNAAGAATFKYGSHAGLGPGPDGGAAPAARSWTSSVGRVAPIRRVTSRCEAVDGRVARVPVPTLHDAARREALGRLSRRARHGPRGSLRRLRGDAGRHHVGASCAWRPSAARLSPGWRFAEGRRRPSRPWRACARPRGRPGLAGPARRRRLRHRVDGPRAAWSCCARMARTTSTASRLPAGVETALLFQVELPAGTRRGAGHGRDRPPGRAGSPGHADHAAVPAARERAHPSTPWSWPCLATLTARRSSWRCARPCRWRSTIAWIARSSPARLASTRPPPT